MASKFQSKIKSLYKSKGYKVLNIIKLGENGYPDLICIKPGEPNIWIECKEISDTLKPLQMARIDELNKLGNIAFCLQDTKGLIYPLQK